MLIIVSAVVGTALTTAVLGLFYLLFRTGQGASRLRVQTIPQVFSLKPSSVSREAGWKLMGTPAETQFVNSLAGVLQGAGGDIARHEYDQLVVYFGSRADAKMNGVLKVELPRVPVRVLFKTRDMGGQIWLQIRFDDDYGLQFFLGSVKKQFHARSHEAFDRIAQIISPALEIYDPKKIRILVGRC